MFLTYDNSKQHPWSTRVGLHVPPDNLDNLGYREDVVEKRRKRGKKEKKTDSRTNTVANYIDTSLLREAAVYHVYIFINVCIIKYIRDKIAVHVLFRDAFPLRATEENFPRENCRGGIVRRISEKRCRRLRSKTGL